MVVHVVVVGPVVAGILKERLGKIFGRGIGIARGQNIPAFILAAFGFFQNGLNQEHGRFGCQGHSPLHIGYYQDGRQVFFFFGRFGTDIEHGQRFACRGDGYFEKVCDLGIGRGDFFQGLAEFGWGNGSGRM